MQQFGGTGEEANEGVVVFLRSEVRSECLEEGCSLARAIYEDGGLEREGLEVKRR